MIRKLVVLSLICLNLFSCKKDSESIAGKDFIEITVNGETFNSEWEKGSIPFPAYDQEGCGSEPYIFIDFSDIVTSKLEFLSGIKHYQNVNDFKNTKPGSYQITWCADNKSSCNLCLEICLSERANNPLGYVNTEIQPERNHNATLIQEGESSSTKVEYTIIGKFSCSFLNSLKQEYKVIGKYQVTIYPIV